MSEVPIASGQCRRRLVLIGVLFCPATSPTTAVATQHPSMKTVVHLNGGREFRQDTTGADAASWKPARPFSSSAALVRTEHHRPFLDPVAHLHKIMVRACCKVSIQSAMERKQLESCVKVISPVDALGMDTEGSST